MQAFLVSLLLVSAIGCGLIAGLYFAFSTFIMTALGKIDRAHGIAAMNSINATILGSLFMPLFFGSTLTSAVLALLGVIHWGEPGAAIMLAGGLIYVVGMFGCTVAFNVPLNNDLAKVGAKDAATVWGRYLQTWTVWNHIRTLASVAAMVLFIIALVQVSAP